MLGAEDNPGVLGLPLCRPNFGGYYCGRGNLCARPSSQQVKRI